MRSCCTRCVTTTKRCGRDILPLQRRAPRDSLRAVQARKHYAFLVDEAGHHPVVLMAVAIFKAATCDDEWAVVEDMARRARLLDPGGTKFALAARGFFRRALVEMPRSAEAVLNFALCKQLYKQDTDGSLRLYMRALALQHSNERVQENLRRVLQSLHGDAAASPGALFVEYQAQVGAVLSLRSYAWPAALPSGATPFTSPPSASLTPCLRRSVGEWRSARALLPRATRLHACCSGPSVAGGSALLLQANNRRTLPQLRQRLVPVPPPVPQPNRPTTLRKEVPSTQRCQGVRCDALFIAGRSAWHA